MINWTHATNSAHCSGRVIYHVLNRANARARIFGKEEDYAAFERVMKETLARKPMRILDVPLLTAWPVERPRQWLLQVNRPQAPAELEELRTSVQRGRPFGSEAWQAVTAEKLGLQSTFQPRGRPRKRTYFYLSAFSLSSFRIRCAI